MSKIGVIHYNFPNFSFDQFLDFAAENKYGYVELRITDIADESTLAQAEAEENAKKVKEKVTSRGLQVSALAAQNDFVQPDAASVEAQVARMKRVCELARVLSDDAVIRTEGGAEKESVTEEKYEDAMYECFLRCAPFLEELDIKLAIDNHGLISNNAELLLSLLKRVDNPRIGSNLDTMNLRWFGYDVETCNKYYDQLAPHALHVHMKDGFNDRSNYIGAALGEGEIDLKHALAALRKANYDGVYCAEYEGPEAEDGVGYAKCAKWLHQNL